jgi:hypothetical protein
MRCAEAIHRYGHRDRSSALYHNRSEYTSPPWSASRLALGDLVRRQLSLSSAQIVENRIDDKNYMGDVRFCFRRDHNSNTFSKKNSHDLKIVQKDAPRDFPTICATNQALNYATTVIVR